MKITRKIKGIAIALTVAAIGIPTAAYAVIEQEYQWDNMNCTVYRSSISGQILGYRCVDDKGNIYWQVY